MNIKVLLSFYVPADAEQQVWNNNIITAYPYKNKFHEWRNE